MVLFILSTNTCIFLCDDLHCDALNAGSNFLCALTLTCFSPLTQKEKARLQEVFEPRNSIYDNLPPQTPLKNAEKSRKNPSKGHPRARTLVEFKEKFPDKFFTICK